MIGLLLQEPDGCKEIVAIDGMVQFLCESMEEDMDPMAMMPSGRQEVTLFNDFKDLVRQSGILRKGQKVLTKSLILSNMTRIIDESVTLEDVRSLLIVEQDSQFLTYVIQSLIEDLAWIKEPSSTPGVSLSDVLDIGRIENSLRLLERLAMVSSKPATVLTNNGSIFPLLVHLITLCRMHAFQDPQQTALVQNVVQFYGLCRNYRYGESLLESEQHQLSTEARQLSTNSRRRQVKQGLMTGEPSSANLKLSSNHQDFQKDDDTHSSAGSESEIEHQDDDIAMENDANGWHDPLLLSLGLLINLLESAPLRRKQLTETAIGLDCKAMGDCFHKECRCEKSLEALERLIDIYNTETGNQVLAAYLALLLCCVVAGSDEDEARLYKRVHGQSLEPMLGLLQGFIALHQASQSDDPGQHHSSKELESTSSPSFNGTLALSDSSMSPNLENYSQDKEDQADGDDCQAVGIVFVNSATRAAETQASFLKIIHLLQDMESRQISPSK
ncbi:hypothetical protein EC968_002588 [Mortierella alpina]|nr:hypothetical protein EC968_002588 [Mortierella alpina]